MARKSRKSAVSNEKPIFIGVGTVKIESAELEFQRWLSRSQLKVEKLTPAQGVDAMLDFYRYERPSVDLGEGGDMLLYQWGTYDWGEGEAFELNITRQFISPETEEEEGDECIWQLGLTFKFTPERIKGASNQWCTSPEKLEDFRKSIYDSEPLKILGNEKPNSVSLEYEQAG